MSAICKLPDLDRQKGGFITAALSMEKAKFEGWIDSQFGARLSGLFFAVGVGGGSGMPGVDDRIGQSMARMYIEHWQAEGVSIEGW